MSSPVQTLIYVARLAPSESASIFALDDAFPTSYLKSTLQAAIEEVCIDRLVRADGCLQLARRLAAFSDEETLRAVVGRAYYSIHHSLRVMALWQNKWDPDGHEESIKQFRRLLQDNAFVHKSGLNSDDWEKVTEARNNRHIADYSPYNAQREPQSTVSITGNSWAGAAQFNTNLAAELLNAAFRIVGL